MRSLTLTQPWAGIVASGVKLIENRPRKMINPDDWGALFAIHASREIDARVWATAITIDPTIAIDYPGPMARAARVHRLASITSAVIGVARIVTFVTDARQIDEYTLDAENQRRWFFGPIGYVLRDVRALERPVPCKGRLGFWTLPTDVAARVEEQLR